MAIISAHPTFAFQHLLDLIIASAVQLDTKNTVSTNVPQRPDLSSCTISAEVAIALAMTFPALASLRPD